MAVYRSDQAQLTFGVEAAPGGYPEIAITPSMTGALLTTAAYSAGTTALTLTSSPGASYIGAVVCIGTSSAAGATAAPQEIRKIEHVIGSVIYLDAPLAFNHLTASKVQLTGGNAVTDAEAGKFINLVPGVYETVDVPDPDMTIEARYFLGTQSKRNFFATYKGQQSYTGSVPGFILLDGRALRFPIGKVVSTANNFESGTITLAVARSKGDVFLTVGGAQKDDASVGDVICIDDGSTSVSEMRKIVAKTSDICQLDYPLQFAHAAAVSIAVVVTTAGGYYTHSIRETVDLDTVSWHLHMRDSAENATNDFDRRYYGGMIGGASLSADEGGMLTMSWDGVNFQGMVHNQSKGSSVGTETVPFYTKMHKITQDGTSDIVFPTTEPYYFSEGSVTIFGQEIARVRSFNLSIANNEEPRYYIQRRYGRQRGPTEIREQRREYSLAVTLALPDTTAPNEATTRLFTELLWEGDYGAGSGTGMQGFSVVLRFDRGTNDSIVITIPDDGTAGTGGNNQGAFIRTAPHAITGDNPLQVDADVLFRNLKIDVTVPTHTSDPTYYYP